MKLGFTCEKCQTPLHVPESAIGKRARCPKCKVETILSEQELASHGITNGDTIYQAKGCPSCLQTGYRGRSGIYEMIEINDHLAGMIHACESQSQIEAYCLTKGKNLRDDGIRKVISGETSLDEVIRVTRENI